MLSHLPMDFDRNGLAAQASLHLNNSHISLTLWSKELSRQLSSHSHRLKPDLRLSIVKIIHIPQPPQSASSASSIPGIALCRTFLPSSSTTSTAASPQLSVVLLSFTPFPSPATTPIRNPTQFVQGREIWVWKPWRVVPLIPPNPYSVFDGFGRLSLKESEQGVKGDAQEAEGSNSAEPSATPIFEPIFRDRPADSLFICDRFGIFKP